jgi:hypothetical protein
VVVAHVVAALAGALVILVAFFEAVKSFVVPRGIRVPFTRFVLRLVFRSVRAFAFLRGARDRETRDRYVAYAAPLGVLALPAAWLFSSLIGYAAIFWAVDGGSFGDAVVVSGSSLFTLGFDRPEGVGGAVTAFTEAAVGLALLAIVISYLPSLNAAFVRRESVVASLAARADTPPDAVTLIKRHHVYAEIEHLDLLWPEWEKWIVEVGESHFTHPVLAFFRSSDPAQSWVTAIAALFDAANFRLSSIEAPGGGNAAAWMFYRAGLSVIRRLAAYFELLPDEPVTVVERADFDRVLARLQELGVPLVADRDDAWERFSRRRAEYEPLIDGLTTLVDAPRSEWRIDD